ncbi:Clp protease ClpP [Catenuloplanes niger JCM 9533]
MTTRARRAARARNFTPAGPTPAAGPDQTRQPPSWYHVGPVLALATEEDGEEAAAESTSADVYVYETIGGWFGMTADDFVRDVASLDVDQIVLHLNSPGGDAFEGVAIANVLRAHRARVVVRVDGMAASAASVIAMAGDEVVMGIGSQMMVHDAWGYAVGNAAEVERYLRRLHATSDSIASTYAARTGGSTEEWRAIMQAESWYTAEEAVAAGLADRIAAADETGTAQGEQVTPGGSSAFWDLWDSLADQARHDLSIYTYAGREHAPAPRIPARQTPAASASGTTTQERSPAVAFSDEQLTTMRQQLGLASDADEGAILAALAERLAEPPAPRTAPGTVTLDEAQHAQLLNDARDGREARAQQLTERRERLVQAAVDDGRIPPARRDHWIAQLAADPGAESTLADLRPGLVPVKEIGYAGTSKNEVAETDPAASDDYWFAGVGAPAKVEG